MNTMPRHPRRRPVALPPAARAAFLAGACCLASTLSAQTAPAVPTPATSEVLQLPTFTVSTTQDVGYRAGNSVSATRIDTPIKDLPFALSAFTDQFINDIGAQDLQDVLRFAPGVTSGDKSFVAGNNRFSIRGFDGDVPPQRNGFAGSRNVDSAIVERVEVVKGPASLLYGQIIPGGTVNYITKRPRDDQFIGFKQSFGNYSDYRTVLDVNTPLGERVTTRVVASVSQDAKWAQTGSLKSRLFAPSVTVKLAKHLTLTVDYEKLHREETPPLGMMPNVQIGTLSAAPSSSSFKNVGARSYQQGLFDAGSINLGFLGAPPIASDFNYQGDHDYKKADYESVNAELNAQLGEHWVMRANYSFNTRDIYYKLTGLAQWDVTPTAAYNTTTTSVFDYLREYLANPSGVLADPTKTASALLNRRKRIQTAADEYNTYEVDFSGQYEFGGVKLNPLVGLLRQMAHTGQGMTLSSSSAYGSYSDTNGALPFTPWNYFDKSTWNRDQNYDEYALPVSSTPGITLSKEDAVYGVLSATLLRDRMILIGGARYDRYQAGGLKGYSYDAKKTTPQVGLGFHVTRDSLLFANYSRSFLVDGTTLTVQNPNYNPAINLNSKTNPNSISVPAKPTTGLGYEAGLKTDFLGGRISSTLTAFHLERADRIVTVRQPVIGLGTTGTTPISTEVTFSKQGTVDQSEGVEFEATVSPLDNWQVYLTYTSMRIKTTKITAPPLRATTDAKVSGDYASYLRGYNDAIAMLLGAVPEGSAERLASLWTRYNFTEGGLKGLWVAGGGNYTSPKAGRTANPTFFFDSYTLFDAAVGYDWKVGKHGWSATLNAKNLTDKVYTPANQSRGKPRQFVFTLATKF